MNFSPVVPTESILQCRLYVDNIGDILQKHMPNMAVYMVCQFLSPHTPESIEPVFDQEYCVNQAVAIKTLQSLRETNTTLSSHLQVCELTFSLLFRCNCPSQRLRDDPAVRNLDLSSYLLAPSKQDHFSPLLNI